jgi:serine/threonine protein kinase
MSAVSPTYKAADSRDAERRLEEFEEAWQGPTPPVLEAYLPRDGDDTARRKFLEELVKIDLEQRWRRASGGHPLASGGRKSPGDPDTAEIPRLEDYLARHPALAGSEGIAADLIGEEYRARYCWGDRPAHAEYERRFPRQWPRLQTILRAVDSELAREFGRREKKVPVAVRVPEAVALPPPVASARAFLDVLAGCQLVAPAQLDELQAVTWDSAHALGKDLLQRGWLTPYQVNQVLLGRGPDLILGPYVLLERLGEGGTGQVFKARHQHLRRIVALKQIRKELLTDPEVVGRFYREIQVVSQLDHPNVVHAFDAGPIGTSHCLVMEYVEGTDLARLVRQSGPLPVNHAAEYIRQAALGLQHAHERGLVHRDIKPSNLFLVSGESPKASTTHHSPLTTHPNTPWGVIKILDLGLARLRRGVDAPHSNIPHPPGALTPVGAVMLGTPDYVAPEQALDFHSADIRADIYSLGCTFYHLLTGRPPFVGGSIARKLLRHQQSHPTAIEVLRSDLPPELAGALRRMMAKDPKHRYQTPAEVAAVLEGWLTTGKVPPQAPAVVSAPAAPPAATAPTAPPPRPRRARTHPFHWVAAAVLASVGLAVVALPFAFRPAPATVASATQSPEPALPPLEQLALAGIAPEDRAAWQPEELVGVVGKRGLEPMRSVAISPDSKYVALGGGHGVLIGEIATGRRWTPQPERSMVWAVAFGPAGRNVTWAAEDRKLRSAELPPADVRILPNAHEKRITALAYSPDGKQLASAGQEGSLKLWEGPRDKPTLLQDKGPPINALAFGKVLVSGDNQSVRLWDLTTHKPKERIPAPKGQPIVALALTADGSLLAAAANNLVRLYDLSGAKPRELPQLRGHLAEVRAVAFAPDGKRIVSADSRGVVILWDATVSQERKRWTFPFPVNGVTFAPDGKHLLTANNDGTGYVLRLGPGAKTGQ